MQRSSQTVVRAAWRERGGDARARSYMDACGARCYSDTALALRKAIKESLLPLLLLSVSHHSAPHGAPHSAMPGALSMSILQALHSACPEPFASPPTPCLLY